MSAKDAMELATKDIGEEVPEVNDTFLEEMITAAIDSNILEKVWRMAFNYDNRIKDKSRLEDYIISSKNGYYISEFANCGFEGIHIDKLVEAIINTKDIKEMSYFIISSRNDVLALKNKQKIEEAIKNLDGWEIYQHYTKKPQF